MDGSAQGFTRGLDALAGLLQLRHGRSVRDAEIRRQPEGQSAAKQSIPQYSPSQQIHNPTHTSTKPTSINPMPTFSLRRIGSRNRRRDTR